MTLGGKIGQLVLSGPQLEQQIALPACLESIDKLDSKCAKVVLGALSPTTITHSVWSVDQVVLEPMELVPLVPMGLGQIMSAQSVSGVAKDTLATVVNVRHALMAGRKSGQRRRSVNRVRSDVLAPMACVASALIGMLQM